MKRALLLLLACAALGHSLLAQVKPPVGKSLFGDLRARHIGPAVMSGRVTSIAVVPDKTEVIYVGSASGGLWKSVSGGTLFRPVFDEHNQSIGKVVLDPSNPETVWVGTGEPWVRNSVSIGDGIYRSTNGGTSWEHLGLRQSERISGIVVHPRNSDVVYVAAQGKLWSESEERGVYKTSDGGKTWQKILYLDPHTGAADLAMDPDNPDILYAAMWSHRRQPWTFDSGFSGKSGLYKSTDGGQTWATIHKGLPDETLGRLAIAVAPSNGQVIYLSVECQSKDKRGLYRSSDQGGSWEKVNNEFNTTVRPFYFARMVADPRNDSIVMKCGLSAIISEDRGNKFRTIDQSVHSDIHDIWINPNNTKHVLVGTDGGMYESFDRGYTFKMWMNLPLSQFYHVSVDNEQPYNVYGGLQDNGSWYGPSQKAGGVVNADWMAAFGGDGFYVFPHPTDNDVVFCEYQGGNIVRYHKKTGRAKDIKPYPAKGQPNFRFNWNTPIHLSPNKPDRMYLGSQFLFRSDDRGDTWQTISPDLTSNDPAKQQQAKSGGLTIDNSTAENHCTIYAIAEAYRDANTVWVGTDDGQVQVTTDGGQTWRNVTKNIPGLPANTWVTFISPGHQSSQVAYVTFDGHRTGDQTPYLYKTTDGGQTWASIAGTGIEGYALSVREDPVNPNLLFLGTEFGLYISVNGGELWSRFENNLPRVGVRDLVIHPRDHALVMATHGRGVVIIDDITPLRQLSQEVMLTKFHFFDTPPTVLRDPGAGGNWFGGSGNFTGENPTTSAQVVYYMDKRHTFGRMYVEVWKDGRLLRSLPASKSAGVNFVTMPTALEKPKAAPTNNRMALFSSFFGPNLPAGEYDVKVIRGRDTFETTFALANDPNSLYTAADRQVQYETTMRLYDMTEQMAYIYHVLGIVSEKTGALKVKDKKLTKAIGKLHQQTKAARDTLVALEGDFYVDEGERIAERIADLYRQVSSYPGRPSSSQMARAELLGRDLARIRMDFDMALKELELVNRQLAEAERVSYPDFAAFKSAEASTGDGGSSQGLRVKGNEMYRRLTGSPLGQLWARGWMF